MNGGKQLFRFVHVRLTDQIAQLGSESINRDRFICLAFDWLECFLLRAKLLDSA